MGISLKDRGFLFAKLVGLDFHLESLGVPCVLDSRSCLERIRKKLVRVRQREEEAVHVGTEERKLGDGGGTTTKLLLCDDNLRSPGVGISMWHACRANGSRPCRPTFSR